MLPNLAGLSLLDKPSAPKPADVDVKLDELPEALLGKVLKETGSARALCDAVDQLQRTSNAMRINRDAWREIAAQYNMPNQPQVTATATMWRNYVKTYCNLIKPTADANGYPHVRFETDQAVWLDEPAKYAWIHSVTQIPVSWIKQDLSSVARTHGNVRFFMAVYDRLAKLPASPAHKLELLSLSGANKHLGLSMWLFQKLWAEADQAAWPATQVQDIDSGEMYTAEMDAQELTMKRNELKSKVRNAAYTAIIDPFDMADTVDRTSLIPLLTGLRAIADPERRHVQEMLSCAVASHWPLWVKDLDDQFRIVAADVAALSDMDNPYIAYALNAREYSDERITEIKRMVAEFRSR